MEEHGMTDKELVTIMIDKFNDLQRLKVAPNIDKELNNQIKYVKAKLDAMGIVTEDLVLDA